MDSVILFPPGPSVAGSQLQIGTYLMYDPGADYGAKGLINSIESSNALRDGGAFGYRNVGPRQMSFPLLLRDVPGQTLLQTETLLRRWTTAGAAVAVQPEGIPSGQAVFFDVIDGRWEPDYNSFENRAGRRKGTLYLDTQPWGYWPTEILLASSASVGQFGSLAVNGVASVIGDVPPLAHVMIGPTVASLFPAGSWSADMIGFSLGARPSFVSFIPGASFVEGLATPSTTGDKYAPASQALIWGPTGNPSWQVMAQWQVPAALEPAYRGRFRAFSLVKSTPSTLPWAAMVDVAQGNSLQALASSNQLATAYNIIPSGGAVGSFVSPSPGYAILDQGEITLPYVASGVGANSPIVRFWAQNPSIGAGSVNQIFLAGLYLLPVDAPAGIVTRGGFQPTLNGVILGGQGGVQAAANWNPGFAEGVLFSDFTGAFYGDARAFYRGLPPRLGASTVAINIISGDRQTGTGACATYPVAAASFEYSKVSVSYRPQFQFLMGI